MSASVLPFGSAQAPIDAYRHAGGVVHYVIVDPADELDRHRAAARLTLVDIERQWQQWVAASMTESGRPASQYATISTEPDRAVSRTITTEVFVGRGYDYRRRLLTGSWVSDDRGNSSKLAAPGSTSMTDGYADAFTDPPHGVHADLRTLSTWFNAINDELLGGLSTNLDVQSWSTDWSTWFNDGHEWWGSFLWTVRPHNRPWIVGIAASATD
jgi:hypothetical protein